MATTMATVRFDGVTKRFPGVVALDGVTFDIAAGSCHALCGENGAGKSTLGKLLAGIYTPDEGRVLIGGAPVRFSGPTDALRSGVAMVHQELSFCENLSVAENLCLGSLPSTARVRLEARDAAPRRGDAGANRRRARRHAPGRRPDHRPAADAPDRVGDRAGGAAHRL